MVENETDGTKIRKAILTLLSSAKVFNLDWKYVFNRELTDPAYLALCNCVLSFVSENDANALWIVKNKILNDQRIKLNVSDETLSVIHHYLVETFNEPDSVVLILNRLQIGIVASIIQEIFDRNVAKRYQYSSEIIEKFPMVVKELTWMNDRDMREIINVATDPSSSSPSASRMNLFVSIMSSKPKTFASDLRLYFSQFTFLNESSTKQINIMIDNGLSPKKGMIDVTRIIKTGNIEPFHEFIRALSFIIKSEINPVRNISNIFDLLMLNQKTWHHCIDGFRISLQVANALMNCIDFSQSLAIRHFTRFAVVLSKKCKHSTGISNIKKAFVALIHKRSTWKVIFDSALFFQEWDTPNEFALFDSDPLFFYDKALVSMFKDIIQFDSVQSIIQDNIIHSLRSLEKQLMTPDSNFDKQSKFFWKMTLLYIITSNQVAFLSEELDQNTQSYQFSIGSCAACPTDGDQEKVFELLCGHQLHQRCANGLMQNKGNVFGSGTISCPLCRKIHKISYPLPPLWKKSIASIIELYKMSHPLSE